MLSLKVAAERADLASLEGRILTARQDIRTLQTELGTRGRLQQLERWNSDVLALSAPVAGQFIARDISLARFDVRTPAFQPDQEVRLASAQVAPAPPAITVAPRQVSLAQAPSEERSAPAVPVVRRASLSTVEALPARAEARPVRRPPAAGRDRANLLDDATLDDLGRAARAERRPARN